ncbi:lasso peptide biosynthesis B2 protein [Niabella yanshanensis]|uniref:Lasso peptide biosynthesis B2 protein n=1 Tax=Niabella yanshanensis TaxID=577386 RepID=A0ABZ0WD13_9BACT|nr:lasso peptide biosynthesis B2 protein [Niabella yanshanensis]WQD40435.1 lasso peptide biosynthesis B2 protein [Niabella yanshanensis]
MRLSLSRKIIVIQAFCVSVYTFFLFRFFNRRARFGEKIPSTGSLYQLPYKKAIDIGWAIQIVAKYISWKNVCRHQAYQAKLLCNLYKIPYMIFVGFKKDAHTNEIEAHAWTVAGGKIITGFCNPDEYMVQSVYKNKWQ